MNLCLELQKNNPARPVLNLFGLRIFFENALSHKSEIKIFSVLQLTVETQANFVRDKYSPEIM
jgi:hypothetical protein